ncbi:MAG: rRNA maturation RNAse YbeY, partial [Clostridia bacterium]|nr:rRNA maturation RNAse YbeY [Clostridia bacterium]
MIIEWTQRVVLHGQAAHPASWTALLADCCQVTEDIPIHTAVHAILTDDREIQKTNAAFRHANQATDVLSFPMISFPPGKTARDCLPLLRKEYDPDGKGAPLGGGILFSGGVFFPSPKNLVRAARGCVSLLFHCVFFF